MPPIALANAGKTGSGFDVGNKARNLSALIRAGFPVPDGIVLGPEAALPPERELERLGPRLAVRSSAGVEDGDGHAAPGVFLSLIDVPPEARRLQAAVEAVRASAQSAAARAYFAARKLAAPRDMAVILQRYVAPAPACGTIYTRAPGRPHDSVARMEARDAAGLLAVVEMERSGTIVQCDPSFPLTEKDVARLLELAMRAEAVVGAGESGADVEWVWSGSEPFLVQARPIIHGRTLEPAPAALFAFSKADPARVWRWDVTHNAEPLSPAQSALVARQAERTGLNMRVVGGYLYTSDDAGKRRDRPHAEELRRLFFESVRPRAEIALEIAEKENPATLERALSAYDEVYALYARELAPALGAARAHVAPQAMATLPALAMPPTEAEWNAVSPAWDVAVPTYREAGLSPRPHPGPRPRAGKEVDALALAVRDISELDDRLFYRAQWVVRRALLERARALGLEDANAVFFCDDPFAALLDAERVTAQADAHRRDVRHAERWHMPLAIRNGMPLAEPWSTGADVWRGQGVGGTASGPVFRLGAAAQTPPAGAVVVAAAIAPGALLLFTNVAAVVSEFDGLLGHTAALARELDIPCVVGCHGSWRDLSEGEKILVDGQAGLVVRLLSNG
jgi:pyruvate,water dikinase